MGYVDRVAVKVWPDTRSADRDMRRFTEKRRETVIQAVLEATRARAELKKLENSRAVMDLDVRTAAAKAKLVELNRQMGLDTQKTVEITADVRAARLKIAELRAQLARTSDKDAKLEIRADVREARAKIAELTAQLARTRDHKVKVNLEATEARRELRKLENDRKVVLQAKAETLNARRELMMVARKRIAEIWVRVNSSKAMVDIKRMVAGLSGLNMLRQWRESLVGLVENLPQTILKVTALASALSLLVLPLMSVLSAMAPIGRSLRAIGPAVLGVIPVFAGMAAMVSVLVLAFRNLRKTSSIEAKRFLRVWDGVKTKFAGVKTAVQDAFFSSAFTSGFKHLTDKLLPDLRKGLAVVATGVGDLGSAMMRAFTKALDDGKLAKFFANLKSGLDRSSPGFAAITGALVGIATEASRLFPKMGDWISDLGRRFQSWVSHTDIAKIVHTAAVEFGNLWQATKNLGGVIAGIFAAMDTGKSTGLAGFADTLERVRKIVWSKRFQAAMSTIFGGAAIGAEALRDALGPIGDAFERMAPTLRYLLGSAGKIAAKVLTGIADALATPAAQNGIQAALDGVADMIDKIPWDQVGRLVGSLGNLIGTLAPGLGDILAIVVPVLPDIVDAIIALLPSLLDFVKQVLPLLVDALGDLLPIIKDLAPVIAFLLTVAAKVIALNWGGVTEALRILRPVVEKLGDAFSWANGQIDQFGGFDGAVKESGRRFADWVMNSFLPFVRSIPGLMWQEQLKITEAFEALPGMVVFALSTLVTLVVDAFGTMFIQAGIIVENGIAAIAGALGQLPMRIAVAVGLLPETFPRLLMSMFAIAQGVTEMQLSALVNLFGGLPLRITLAIAPLAAQFSASVRRGLNAGNTAAIAGITQMVNTISQTPMRIILALGTNLGKLLYPAGRSIMNGLWAGMTAVWATMMSWISGIAQWIRDHKGPLSYDYRLLQPAGKAIMAGFGDSLAAGMSKVEALVSDFAPRVSANVRVAGDGSGSASADGVFSPSALAEALADTLEARGMSWLAVSDRVSAVRTLAEEMA